MGTPTAVHGADSDRRHGRPDTALAVWATAGLVGSSVMVLSGTRIGSIPRPGHGAASWWFSVPTGGTTVALVTFYIGLALVVVAWLGVGSEALAGRLTVRWSWLLLGLWGLPLLLGPPLFSRDVYSYIAQGVIAHRGLDPYAVGPAVLGPGPLLSSVAEVWRHTSSPYGPLFVGATRVLAAITGTSVIAGVLVFRSLELVGVVLTLCFLPRLARHLGTDAGVALWLGALSPLALFSFLSSGHNDALMVGLLVAGVTLAVEGRLLAGLAVCAVAATVKLPAAGAVVFLVVDHVRSGRGAVRRREVVVPVLVAVAVFVGITLACGYGFSWLGPGALHVPTELRIASTPSVAVGDLVFHLLHLVHVPALQSSVVTVTQTVFAVAGVLGCLWLLLTVHRHEVVRSLGLALLLFVVASPTVWPWYLLWGLVLLAATTAQRSKVLAAVAAVAMLAVGSGGTPEISGARYLVVALATLGGVVWMVRDGHWRTVVTGRAGGVGAG